MKQINFNINIDLEQDELISKLIRQLSSKNIEEFIKQLDKACQEWGITENLYKHFRKLHFRYVKECIEEYENRECPECKTKRLYIYDEEDEFCIKCRNCSWKEDL
jgi:hypothetical protein